MVSTVFSSLPSPSEVHAKEHSAAAVYQRWQILCTLVSAHQISFSGNTVGYTCGLEEMACIGSGWCGINAPPSMDLIFHFLSKEKKNSMKKKKNIQS